ncbi:3-oxoacyl-ACP synthase [Polaribacter sp. Z014]|uniref:3-oxoacyl-ACP synthase n=1 Tax=unclassified Polaribacter TaxID=196858 RepID=UPI00193B3400|nr:MULTISPECIES: 3-oxoacyl-ACP synthase [unclassified Polaribacter]MCL7762080.1 3-oxoacyl-ACP synthase [Polaribacter sp. Z014]QVY64489.1 3-oxoacyl-ACP synthase [Polaribacter sp. Q13]
MSELKIKEALFKQCETFVNKRLQTVNEIISSNQKALQSETKSSAGDKHETGRAMLQLEMEKAGQQLAGITIMKEILAKIDVSKISKVAHLGTVIETDSVNYFLSISAGKLIVANKVFFAVSVSSPIGKILLGKKIDEKIIFNGNTSSIKRIR